jgi:hypothetical protein
LAGLESPACSLERDKRLEAQSGNRIGLNPSDERGDVSFQ